jgi:protein Hikeshi
MFGIIYPGHPVLYTFTQVSETQWTSEVASPGLLNNLTFFLQNPLPDGYALALSSSSYPYESLEFLGAIANERPSDIIHTGWSFKPEIANNPIKLLISMELIPNIVSLVENKANSDIRQVYAKKVALNLFRFMESFNKNTTQHELLVLPCDVLDKWLIRFESKFRLDPNFVLNTE